MQQTRNGQNIKLYVNIKKNQFLQNQNKNMKIKI